MSLSGYASSMGVGSGGRGPYHSWIFIHGTDIVDRVFFGIFFAIFCSFFRCPLTGSFPPHRKRFNSAIFGIFYYFSFFLLLPPPPLPPEIFLPTPLATSLFIYFIFVLASDPAGTEV